MKNIELEMYKGFFDRVENIIVCTFCFSYKVMILQSVSFA